MYKNQCYVPELISEEDLRRFKKGNMGRRGGFGRKAAVAVVDMTRAFVDEGFPLADAETGRPCVAAIRRLLEAARPLGIPVYYTRWDPTWVTDNERGRWLDKGTQLREPSEAHDIAREIAPQPGEVIINKAKPSAFFGTQFAGLLIHRGIDTLIVTGMVTSGCVRATVVDAFSYNFKVVIPEECVADRGRTSHQVNLFDMDQKYADVMPLDEVLARMESLTAKVLEGAQP